LSSAITVSTVHKSTRGRKGDNQRVRHGERGALLAVSRPPDVDQDVLILAASSADLHGNIGLVGLDRGVFLAPL